MTHEIELPSIHPGKSAALIAVGLAIYLTYIYHVGHQEVAEILSNVNLSILAAVFSLSVIAIFFNTLSWKKVAEQLDYRVSLKDMFLMYLSGFFLNNLIPSGSFSGETARIYFLNNIAENSRLDATSATVAATRIIAAIPFILGMGIGLVYITLFYEIPAWALAICILMMLFAVSVAVIFVVICFTDGWLLRIIDFTISLVERLSDQKIDREICNGAVCQFHKSMDILTANNSALFISVIWATTGWFSMNMVAFAAFKALDVKITVFAIFAVYAVIIVFQTLPIILPGGVGLVDIIMTSLFGAVGVSIHDAAAVTILIRLVQLCFITALGGIATIHLLRQVNHNNNHEKPAATKSF